MKNILLLGNALIDRVEISGLRIDFEGKNDLFLKKFLDSNFLQKQHILLTLFTNTKPL